MGWASRSNPRSLDHACSERDVLNARLIRFGEFFATRAEYEAYLTKAKITPAESAYLESLLPAHLTFGGTV
jgi:hypothetical protein